MSLTLLRWRPGKLARSGSSLLGWMLLRAAAQAGIVILLARELGAQPYGEFVAIIAVASFFTPFAGVGMSQLVLRNGARDSAYMPIYLSRAIRWWGISILPCTAIAIAAAILLLPTGFPVLAAFVAITSELVASSLIELRARHQQAQQKINTFGAINAGLPAVRLIALCVLFLTQNSVNTTVVLWAYAAGSIAYTLAVWAPMYTAIRTPDGPASEPMTPASSLPFSLSTFAVRLQNEFNKPILAHAGFGLAGTYNVAQRMVDMASMPLSALYESLWPRLYAQQNPMRQLRHTGLILLVLASVLGAIVWLIAPVLPLVLGPSFANAVGVVRWLAWLPVLQVLRYLVNFYVVHRAWMSLIGWAYGVGAVISVLLVAILVPRTGMVGAVIAAYVSELATFATLLIGYLKKRLR